MPDKGLVPRDSHCPGGRSGPFYHIKLVGDLSLSELEVANISLLCVLFS